MREDPDYSPEQELLDRLERVRVLLAHALDVRRAIAKGGGQAGALEGFLHKNREPGFVAHPAAVEQALASVDAHVAERVGARETRFTRLVAMLRLSPLERDLLLAAVAPTVRRGFREAMLLIGPEAVAGGVHPAAHLIELVSSSSHGYVEACRAVDDASPLVRDGALLAQPMSAVAPPLWRALAPSMALYRWLRGQSSPYPLLDRTPALRRAVDDEVSAHLDHLLGAGPAAASDNPEPATPIPLDRPVRVLLLGEPGAGRTRAAAALAHRLGRRAAIAPWPTRASASAAPADALAAAALDARLRQRLLYIASDSAEAGPHGDRNGTDALGALAALAALDAPGWACAVAAQPGSATADALLAAGFARVDVRPPALPAQVRAWRGALGEDFPEADITDLVRGHALPFHAIEQAAAQAVSDSGVIPPATDDDQKRRLLSAAEHAASGVTSDRLAQIADRLSTTLSWDDLVLPEDARASVDEIWRAASVRQVVYEGWGFDAKTPYGRAISAIFSGPPGTGKTMVATLIARQLGLELYRVDLSRLVDKYIGETEKHLATLFAEAERGRCVLLFDEADALFGKRSKAAESATDRYANLEVNYLLQRIETFSGIVLLTTNQETLIDDAFKRRIRYRVEFPFPEEDEREALWRRLFPEDAPLADDVDPAALARRYELSGGHIKNAVLRAAFAAAARALDAASADGADSAIAIDQASLIHAANQELENIGKLVMR